MIRYVKTLYGKENIHAVVQFTLLSTIEKHSITF